MGGKASEEIMEALVTRKLGDEQSSLLDKFERLSFEAQLNKAMQPLGRSLSEPRARLSSARRLRENLAAEGGQGWRSRLRCAAALKNAVKKLIGPMLGSGKNNKEVVVDHKDPNFWSEFSRSMRF